MFLRIRLEPEDRKFHRFYWNGKIWQFVSIAFGVQCCPNISQKVITTHAESVEDQYPDAAKVVIDKTYMDDSITSEQTEEMLIKIAHQLIPLMKGINMFIMKFYSNSKMLVNSLDPKLLSKKVTFSEKEVLFEESKVLGMTWEAMIDILKYISKFANVQEFFDQLNIKKNPVWTKRLILKLSATVYDPLGLISPYTVKARSILQELWKVDIGWDQEIPVEYSKRWQDWLDELFVLASTIAIPRWLQFKDGRTASIHVFCDASSRVFCCCAYVRITTGETSRGEKDAEIENEEVLDVLLITAKSRVTPTKTESISRLELAGCVLGVRLGNAVATAFRMNPEEINYWTDSTNCLYWITSPSSISRTFVSNRVGEIQNESKQDKWRHVPTDQNPADVPTRFPKVDDLKKSKLWWNGPDFLLKSEEHWPEKFIPTPDAAGKEEMKKEYANFYISMVTTKKNLRIARLNPSNYSVGSLFDGFKILLNNTAIAHGCSSKTLSAGDRMRRGLEFQIRRSQDEDDKLCELRKTLMNGQKNEKTYLSLLPYVDKRGILRSQSRLAKVDFLPYNTRFPVILSSESEFTKLLVQSAHREQEHGIGENAVKAKLKGAYHIIGLEPYLRTLRSECRACIRKRAKPFEQRIANLPSYRFEEPLRAFIKTGLDFAGPYEIKVGRAKARPKYYILLFTCLQTRAVHLEVTPAMDTNAVVLAFDRFIAYRGCPTDFLSDNWKTFVSRDKELEHWVRNISELDTIRSKHAEINWHFTPPHGPHHGGVYETMVKATKRCLKSLCAHPDLNLDEFTTFVVRTASMLNGRPITKVVEDGESMILTPNHFLIGNLGGAVSTIRVNDPIKRWHQVQHLLDKFWKIFLSEYLIELGKARKWQKVKKNVAVGDLVLEIDPNTDSGNWTLAVVKEVLPSNDGLVRKVIITTNGKDYTRPITRLAPLEYNVNDNEIL